MYYRFDLDSDYITDYKQIINISINNDEAIKKEIR
jgi:hypothetical protein